MQNNIRGKYPLQKCSFVLWLLWYRRIKLLIHAPPQKRGREFFFFFLFVFIYARFLCTGHGRSGAAPLRMLRHSSRPSSWRSMERLKTVSFDFLMYFKVFFVICACFIPLQLVVQSISLNQTSARGISFFSRL